MYEGINKLSYWTLFEYIRFISKPFTDEGSVQKLNSRNKNVPWIIKYASASCL